MNTYSIVIVQPYDLIHRQWSYICGIDLKTGLISRKLHKRSDISGLTPDCGCTSCRTSSLIVTVTVSAAGDVQASGKRQLILQHHIHSQTGNAFSGDTLLLDCGSVRYVHVRTTTTTTSK